MTIEQELVDIVFEAQGGMTLNDLCQPGVQEHVADKCRERIGAALDEHVTKRLAYERPFAETKK